MTWKRCQSGICLLSQQNKITQANLTRERILRYSQSHTVLTPSLVQEWWKRCLSIKYSNCYFPFCVFQLHVRGAHGQGHDGKNATNIWELWDELVWNTDVQEKQWVATPARVKRENFHCLLIMQMYSEPLQHTGEFKGGPEHFYLLETH